jgi:hypothetical protein
VRTRIGLSIPIWSLDVGHISLNRTLSIAQVPMALPNRRVGVRNSSVFKVRQQVLQKLFAAPSFEPNLLPIDPRILGCRV